MNDNLKVSLSDDCSWDGLTLEIHFLKSIFGEDKEKIKKTITEWADKGIDKGYGDGVMHYLGNFEWNKNSDLLSINIDMGSSEESALTELSQKLTPYSILIKEIKAS